MNEKNKLIRTLRYIHLLFRGRRLPATPSDWKGPAASLFGVIGLVVFAKFKPETPSDMAAWVLAFGTIGLVWGTFRVSREERAQEALEHSRKLRQIGNAVQFIALEALKVACSARDQKTSKPTTVSWDNFKSGKRRRLEELTSVLSQIAIEDLAELDILETVINIRSCLVDASQILIHAQAPDADYSTWTDSKGQLESVIKDLEHAKAVLD